MPVTHGEVYSAKMTRSFATATDRVFPEVSTPNTIMNNLPLTPPCRDYPGHVSGRYGHLVPPVSDGYVNHGSVKPLSRGHPTQRQKSPRLHLLIESVLNKVRSVTQAVNIKVMECPATRNFRFMDMQIRESGTRYMAFDLQAGRDTHKRGFPAPRLPRLTVSPASRKEDSRAPNAYVSSGEDVFIECSKGICTPHGEKPRREKTGLFVKHGHLFLISWRRGLFSPLDLASFFL